MNHEQPIVVLGARGMLGHVVVRCLREKGWSVIESDVRWTPQNAEPEIRSLQAKGVGAVVNAMGSYLQDPDARERDSMQWINGRFPTILSATLSPQTLLIHASSDAVFGSRASGCLWNDSFSRLNESFHKHPEARDPKTASELAWISSVCGDNVAERMVGKRPLIHCMESRSLASGSCR